MLSNITARAKLLVAGFLVAVLAVVALLSSQRGSGPADVPVLLADTNKPIRTKPKDAGGVEVPHTGVLVFDVLADDSGNVEQVINNAPSTSDLAITQSTAQNNDEDPIAKLIEGQSEERKLLQDMAEDGTKDYGQPRVSASMPSGYAVQIGAYRSLERAWAVGSQLVVQEEILENMNLQVVEVDLTQKGQFYRVVFGPAEGEDHAMKICEYFVGEGRDCVIVGGGA